ncbi:MAG: hypothetical protein D3914_15545 [Candidatus Electrothrix sp. LOE2]|jgi:hypothetical protein|nr:hypothetical protein [Candidatus Electrothrix sp. LOE2]
MMFARVVGCQEMKYRTAETGISAQLLAGCTKEGYSDKQIRVLQKPQHHLSGTGPMPSKSHTCPEIRASLVSFDTVPRHEKGLLHMVRDDLSRMENATEQQQALAQCNVYRAQRSETQIKIEFLDMNKPVGSRILFRMVYELASPLI